MSSTDKDKKDSTSFKPAVKSKSEADLELEKMFGSKEEEENAPSFLQRTGLSLVSS